MNRIVVVSAACLMLFVAAANADVTVKRQVTFQMLGMPEMEMVSTEQLNEAKSCSRTEFAPNSMMGMMGGEQKAEMNITRLDKGVMWNVNEDAKIYSEYELSELGAEMDQADLTGEEDASDKYEWTVEVEPQELTDINGFPCTGIIATATGVHKENADETVVLVFEQWVSDEVPGQETLDAYDAKFSDVTGMERQAREKMVKKLAAKFGTAFDKLAERTADLEGYPIKITLTGKTTVEVPSATGMTEEDLKDMDPEAKAMMERFMPKKDEASGDGMNILFSVATEVMDIKTEDVDDSAYEIPEGYTKQ